MFSTGNIKINAAVAAVKKARLNSGSTSSFDAVSKLDSTSSSVMDVTNGSSGCGEIMNFDMSMSSNGSGESGETLDSEFGRVLQLNGAESLKPAPDGSPRFSPAVKSVVVVPPLNAPKAESNRGNQRMLSSDDVFDAAGCGNEGGRGDSSAQLTSVETGVPFGPRKSTGAVNLGAAEMLYAKEIFGHFMKTQGELQATIPFPASLGTLARGDTRAILISWIVQVLLCEMVFAELVTSRSYSSSHFLLNDHDVLEVFSKAFVTRVWK